MAGRNPQVKGFFKNAKDFTLRAQSGGMYLYRKADHSNRGVSYLAGYLSVKEHAALLRKGDIDKFLFKTGIAGESITVMNRILKPLENVDPRGWDVAVEKAAKEYGTRVAQDSQFIYNPANAPKWMQNIVGRHAGQFMIWPIAFGEYMHRNMSGLIGAGGVRRQFAMRFIARHAAMSVALGVTGNLLGIDTSSYNKANPLSYEGGPLVNLASDLIVLGTGSEGEFGSRLAMRNVKRAAQTFITPFGGAVQDVRQALDENDPTRAFITLLGFTTQDPELFK